MEKEDLIGKVNMDFRIPVVATVSAHFAINIMGYFIVLISLAVFGEKFNYSLLPMIAYPLLQLYLLAIALGLLLSALQIFVRDTIQLMTTLMTLWFFLTPIIYPESMIPEKYLTIIKINPIYTPISFIHNATLSNAALPWFNMGILSIAILMFLYLSNKMFTKLTPSFEEFK